MQRPESEFSECVRCILKGIISEGGSERIILHGNSDLEYHGDPVSTFKEIAEVGNLILTIPKTRSTRKCRMCKVRPSAVRDAVWSAFPEPDLDGIRQTINAEEPSGRSCEECLMQTYRSLDQIEYLLNRISKNAAKCAFNLVEM